MAQILHITKISSKKSDEGIHFGLNLSFCLFPCILGVKKGSCTGQMGQKLPKIDKNYTFLPCYLKRLPPIDVLTISNDFRHKTGIIMTHFSCFLIHIAITRGSMGSFPGVILPKIDKNHTLVAILF